MINSVNAVQSMAAAHAGGSNPGRTPSEVADSFFKLLQDKQEKEMTAKEYLETLTSEQLYTIQTAQRMAVRINVDKLSEEGAENLFVPLGDSRKYVDFNNDGITEIGEGKIFVFPPPNAPDSVKDAWEKATKNMSFEEQSRALSPFMAARIEANSHQGSDGSYKVASSIEPGYVNIFGAKAEDYCSLIDKIIDKLVYFSKGLSGEQKENYEFKIRTMQEFKDYILINDTKE